MTQNPVLTAVIAGSIGSAVAVLSGREKTRIDNALIGGLFTGFAAYRDPRSSLGLTLVVAAVEGAIWGITDRTTPYLKDLLLPPEPEIA